MRADTIEYNPVCVLKEKPQKPKKVGFSFETGL